MNVRVANIEDHEKPVADYVKLLEEAHRSVAVINRILKSLHAALDLDELEKNAKRLARELLNLNTFSLMIYDATRGRFVFKACEGIPEAELDALIDASLANRDRWLDRQASPILLDIDLPELTVSKRYLLVSLDSHGKTMGIFVFPEAEGWRPSTSELEMLTVIAAGLLCAYHNARIYNVTRKMVIWDVKTDLYNHRYFLKALSNEICRARRYGRNLSLIVLDVNNFKAYNDRYGHLDGDRALADIAKIIKRSIRVVDIAARFGGDEFFVLLPETDEEGARVVARRLEQAIRSHNFHYVRNSRRKTPVTLSVACGIATLEDTMTAREFMELADRRMLEEKRRYAEHSRTRRS
jgi:diguanylate cyclase (GGDEF)-like protein